jgi:hypothetical protein
VKTSDGWRGFVSHYNQRVTAVAAKLSTYQITQEGNVSLFPNRGPPSDFSKDRVFVERTENVDDYPLMETYRSKSMVDVECILVCVKRCSATRISSTLSRCLINLSL